MENLTIIEALDKYPNSESAAFFLDGDENSVYFMTEKPLKINSTHPEGLNYSVACIKLIRETGIILNTKVYTKKNSVVTPVKFAKFKLFLEEGLEKVKAMENNPYKSSMLLKYTQIGFNL